MNNVNSITTVLSIRESSKVTASRLRQNQENEEIDNGSNPDLKKFLDENHEFNKSKSVLAGS